MRIVNENFENVDESEIDLSKGRLVTATAIKEDAEPIDDITKFAWADEDYEEVRMYMLNREEPSEPQSSQTDELTQVIDALLGFGGDQNG